MAPFHGQSPLDLPLRIVWFLVALVLLTLLGLAVWLNPDPYGTGYGTHQQLGLPPCTFTTVLKIRCPSCGMTTAWAYTVRGQLHKALGANVGGTLLALLAIVLVPWLAVTSIRGRWLFGRPRDMAIVIVAAVVLGVTLVDWCFRLWLG